MFIQFTSNNKTAECILFALSQRGFNVGRHCVLGPLGIIARPVPVGGQVHPRAVPHEAHHPPVRCSRHPGLEVVHDAQSLGGPLEVIGSEVGHPDRAVTRPQVASPDILH